MSDIMVGIFIGGLGMCLITGVYIAYLLGGKRTGDSSSAPRSAPKPDRERKKKIPTGFHSGKQDDVRQIKFPITEKKQQKNPG